MFKPLPRSQFVCDPSYCIAGRRHVCIRSLCNAMLHTARRDALHKALRWHVPNLYSHRLSSEMNQRNRHMLKKYISSSRSRNPAQKTLHRHNQRKRASPAQAWWQRCRRQRDLRTRCKNKRITEACRASCTQAPSLTMSHTSYAIYHRRFKTNVT